MRSASIILCLVVAFTTSVRADHELQRSTIENDGDHALQLEDLSTQQTRSLLASWGLSSLLMHDNHNNNDNELGMMLHNANGHMLSLLTQSDVEAALHGASSLAQRLALRSLLVKVAEAKQHGVAQSLTVASLLDSSDSDKHGKHGDDVSDVAVTPSGAAAESSHGRKLGVQQQRGFSAFANGTIDWAGVDLANFSGVSMKTDLGAIKFGSSSSSSSSPPSTVFRAAPGWLGVQGNVSVEGMVLSSNIARIQRQLEEIIQWKDNVSATIDDLADGGVGLSSEVSSLNVTGNLTVSGGLEWAYKQTRLASYLDKIDELSDEVGGWTVSYTHLTLPTKRIV